MTETKPFDILQTLEGEETGCSIDILKRRRCISLNRVCTLQVFCIGVYLESHVGDVDQLVVCKGEQVEEAELRESSRLDLFHAVTVDHELLQRGQTVKRLLDSQSTKTFFFFLYCCTEKMLRLSFIFFF